MKVSLVRARYPSVWEPTNLMYISAYLKKNYVGNIDCKIYDCFHDADDIILEKIKDSDYVGISGTTPQVPHMKILAEKIKTKYPDMKIVVGGYGPSLEPFKLLNENYIDFVVAGEGEQAMLDIINGKIKTKLVSVDVISDVNSIPEPDRESFDLNKYISIAEKDEGRRVTSIMSERGCPFGCTFCAEGEYGTIWRKSEIKDGKIQKLNPTRMRCRNPKLIVEEMIKVRDKFNITFFKMNDAETNPTRSHFINICKEIVRQNLNVPWGCNMRCDKIDDDICKWAVKAQCNEFWMGIEAGSPEIHRDIKKGTTIPMIRNAFAITKKYGIKRRCYVLLGTPLESHDTVLMTENLIDEIEPDIVGFSILAPYPGTTYYKPEFDKLDWSQIDEFSNTIWKSNFLTNKELRTHQSRLIEKYTEKLAPIIRKKQKLNIGGSQTLDTLMNQS